MDKQLRQLERQTATGDSGAKKRLYQYLERAGFLQERIDRLKLFKANTVKIVSGRPGCDKCLVRTGSAALSSLFDATNNAHIRYIDFNFAVNFAEWDEQRCMAPPATAKGRWLNYRYSLNEWAQALGVELPHPPALQGLPWTNS